MQEPENAEFVPLREITKYSEVPVCKWSIYVCFNRYWLVNLWVCNGLRFACRLSLPFLCVAGVLGVLLHDFFRIAPEEGIHHDVLGWQIFTFGVAGNRNCTETQLESMNGSTDQSASFRSTFESSWKLNKDLWQFSIYKFKKSPWNHPIKIYWSHVQ